jgi:hypothetical protein
VSSRRCRRFVDLLLCIPSAAAVLALVSGQGFAENAEQSRGCFEATLEQSRGPIRRIVLDLENKKLMVEQWGLAHAPFFDDGMDCGAGDNNELSCSVVCDGGGMTATRRPDGRMTLRSSGMRMKIALDSLLPTPAEAGGGSFGGTYTVAPVPEETCRTAFAADRLAAIALRPGDFSPRVKSLEKALSNLGYFAQQPDWYFTDATADALRAFQRFVGLEPTGVGDGKTVAKLRLLSVLRGGC